MYTCKTLFAQLMDFLPWTTFTRIVERHGGDRYVKSLACTEQFWVMAFAQLTCARTCATSKSASRRGRPSATTWDSGRRSSVRRWPMPTSRETGAYYSAWASAHSGWSALGYPCRIRPVPDRASAQTPCGRQPWHRVGVHDLSAGLDDHRSVSVALPVGAVSHDEVCGEDAHAARLEGQHSQLHPHLGRQVGRRQCARHPSVGARGNLRHGSRLTGLRAA